jgi:hypothetical protein
LRKHCTLYPQRKRDGARKRLTFFSQSDRLGLQGLQAWKPSQLAVVFTFSDKTSKPRMALESVWVNAAEKQVLKAQPTMGLCIDVAML